LVMTDRDRAVRRAYVWSSRYATIMPLVWALAVGALWLFVALNRQDSIAAGIQTAALTLMAGVLEVRAILVRRMTSRAIAENRD
jgi:hypothetical protein